MQGCGGEEQRKKEKKGFENNFQSLTHLSIPIDNHFNNSSINLNINLSLSLSLWMKTQTHTQLINIYHTNHHQSISSTTTIHIHSFSFHKQHTQSLSKQSFLFSILKSISSSLLSHSSHSIQQCDSINNISSFFIHYTSHSIIHLSLIMNELSQVF